VRGDATPGAADRRGASVDALLADRARDRAQGRHAGRPAQRAGRAAHHPRRADHDQLAQVPEAAGLTVGRKRTDIEPRIVAAARERFLREGVDGASLRAIAADAGTSIGMVYYYFKTKDDLFLAVVEAIYSTLVTDLTAAMSNDVTPRERMRRLYRRIGAMNEL